MGSAGILHHELTNDLCSFLKMRLTCREIRFHRNEGICYNIICKSKNWNKIPIIKKKYICLPMYAQIKMSYCVKRKLQT